MIKLSMTKTEVNVFINDLYNLIDEANFESASLLLLDKLAEILTLHPAQPTERPIEYDLVEYLFFRFDDPIDESKQADISDIYPLNSYLLQCFDNPDEVNAILFHTMEYLLPNGYQSYSVEELADSIDRLREGKSSLLPKHKFSYSKGNLKIEQNGTTHLVSI